LKKTVLIVALTFSALLTSCNKKVEETTQEQMPIEETATQIVDTTETDTVAPMDEPTDSISQKK
jgi:PBP1b-binding outer membrane lipoprotein LpoB